MKFVYLTTLLFFPLFVLLSSCADEPVAGDSKVRIPWPNKSSGEYSIRDVEVSGLKNLSPFEGEHADFKLAPDIKQTHLKGSQVKVKAERKGGLIIPTDELSSEVLTIYAHIEHLRELDRRLGYDQRLSWPRQVGVRVQAKRKSGAINRNNAFYFSGADALLLVPYTKKSVPISLNAGILAHEHFHAHFHHLLKKDIRFDFALANGLMTHVAADKGDDPGEAKKEMSKEKLAQFLNATLLRGLNEGLADYWGWLYTQDERFIERSLKGHDYRRMDQATMGIPTPEVMVKQLLEHLGEQNQLEAYAYRVLAPRFSRFFKSMAEMLDDDSQYSGAERVALYILETLPQYRSRILQVYKKDVISLDGFVDLFNEKLGTLSGPQCELIFKLRSTIETQAQVYNSCPRSDGSTSPQKDNSSDSDDASKQEV